MTRHAWGVWLALAACAPPSGPDAKVWAVKDFIAKAPTKNDFGGWRADQLVTFEGQPIPFRSPPHAAAEALQGPGYGLTVFPAFSEGTPASFVITEIWLDHPTPWVQPTWVMVSSFEAGFPASANVSGVPPIFAVDVGSTFYSPFWRGTYVLAPRAEPDTFTSAKAVLDAELPTQEGTVVLCPIAPADGGAAVAEGEATPTHPWVLAQDVGLDGGARLPAQQFGARTAWVEGRRVPYLGVGQDRVAEAGQLPVEAPLYVFAAPGLDGGLEPLPIPAVLPRDPFRSAFVRRTDVRVPAGAAVFVPADRPALAEALTARGVAVVSPAGVPESTARLRLGGVIREASCLSGTVADAGLPDGGGDDGGVDGGGTSDGGVAAGADPLARCTWLDSVAAIEGLNAGLRRATGTTLAITVTQVGAKVSR